MQKDSRKGNILFALHIYIKHIPLSNWVWGRSTEALTFIEADLSQAGQHVSQSARQNPYLTYTNVIFYAESFSVKKTSSSRVCIKLDIGHLLSSWFFFRWSQISHWDGQIAVSSSLSWLILFRVILGQLPICACTAVILLPEMHCWRGFRDFESLCAAVKCVKIINQINHDDWINLR